MGILKSTSPENLPPVRYEVKGEEIDLTKVNRFIRKLMQSVGAKQQRKFAPLVHPETGERPDIVVAIPDPGKPSVQIRLVTDSEVLRTWLKGQGIVIGEVVAEETA